MASRLRIPLRLAAAGFLMGGAAYLAALRGGAPAASHNYLLWSAAGLVAVLPAEAALAFLAAARGLRRVASLGEGSAAVGLLGVVAFGLANWAYGIQGVALLMERSPVALSNTEALVALSSGPLADPRERDVTVALGRLRLEGAGPDGFRAVSRLRILPAGAEEQGVTLSLGRGVRVGTLIYHQGAFGFAPRVVLRRGGTTLLDEYVPFRTVREGREGIAFVEDFEAGPERLFVRGAVTLEDLNDDMKGHPKLELAVERNGRPIGTGTLRPGQFAELEGGLSVGFTGLQRWSEVIFSRRNYRLGVLAGVVVAALGAVAWVVGAWRRR